MLASEPAERKSVWTNRMTQLEVRLTDHTIGCPNLQASTSGRLRVLASAFGSFMRASENSGFLCHDCGLSAVLGFQFPAEGADVQFDCDLLQVQLTGDFLVGKTAAQST